MCLGEPELELWHLAESYPMAQGEVLEVWPRLKASLSPGKANRRRYDSGNIMPAKALHRLGLAGSRLRKWGNMSRISNAGRA